MPSSETVGGLLAEDNVDGVGEGAVLAMPGVDVNGDDEKTPFITLFWVMLGIGFVVALVMTLAFLIPYLTTGHWPS